MLQFGHHYHFYQKVAIFKREFLCKLLHYKIKQKVVIFKVHLRNTTIIEEKTVIKSSKCDLTEMMKVACKDACTTGSLGEFSWM